MKVALRKFNLIDFCRFLSLKLNKKTSNELSNTFFGYIFAGLKNLFKGGKIYKFAILANGKFAGSISLYNPKNGVYEIGYFVFKEYRNKGIATKRRRKFSLRNGFVHQYSSYKRITK